MSVFDTVSAQMNQLNVPLFAVSLTAIPRPDTPLLLMLHWHGFQPRSAGRSIVQAQTPAPACALPSSALQLGLRWLDLASVEREVLDAAWQLGAWNLERQHRRACNSVGASAREALECQRAFGEFGGSDATEALVEEAPDRHEMLQLAARVGYVVWHFRPVAGGIWPAAEGDDTLGPTGYREPPCPVKPLTCSQGPSSRTVYRLGRVQKISSGPS